MSKYKFYKWRSCLNCQFFWYNKTEYDNAKIVGDSLNTLVHYTCAKNNLVGIRSFSHAFTAWGTHCLAFEEKEKQNET